jgi:hypothetical protein
LVAREGACEGGCRIYQTIPRIDNSMQKNATNADDAIFGFFPFWDFISAASSFFFFCRPRLKVAFLFCAFWWFVFFFVCLFCGLFVVVKVFTARKRVFKCTSRWRVCERAPHSPCPISMQVNLTTPSTYPITDPVPFAVFTPSFPPPTPEYPQRKPQQHPMAMGEPSKEKDPSPQHLRPSLSLPVIEQPKVSDFKKVRCMGCVSCIVSHSYPPFRYYAPPPTHSHLALQRKRGRPPLEKDSRLCTNCGTSETPEWRKGPLGPHTYLFYLSFPFPLLSFYLTTFAFLSCNFLLRATDKHQIAVFPSTSFASFAIPPLLPPHA